MEGRLTLQAALTKNLVLQGTLQGGRLHGDQRKKAKKWTGRSVQDILTIASGKRLEEDLRMSLVEPQISLQGDPTFGL